MKDIIVIGAGPCGLTAAVYARRAGKSVLVLEKETFGGQVNFSPKIENYSGFPEISGTELADKLVEHALAQGAEIDIEEVTGLTKDGDVFTVTTDSGEHTARAVIIATGAKHRRLHLPGEDALIGDGISFCAVCDGAFYEGKEVIVIGGGNSALQEALLLSETSAKVTVLQNLADFTGERQLAEALLAKNNVEAHFGVTVTAFESENGKITVSATQNGEQKAFVCDGVFEAIGLVPENTAFEGLVALDHGYVDAGEACTTKTPGVFCGGDCRTKKVRQIATAVADGATAALAACEYLS